MKCIMIMFDSLNRNYLPNYNEQVCGLENFKRLSDKMVTFENSFVGSMPCMPARREIHTGRYNFLHRSWGPIEPFDDSMPEILSKNGIYTHLISDHSHYWEDGGATYHQRYSSWENIRGQEADKWVGIVDGYDYEKPFGMTYKPQEKNRERIQKETDFPLSKTFESGMEFIKRNKDADNWFLQIETFAPHEPFFASEKYKKLYDIDDDCDWPVYGHISEMAATQQNWYNGEVQKHYKALLSMCDEKLGEIIDLLDNNEMWNDTMVIVNTDHGFMLGEHGFFGKCIMPFYNEVANTPFFMYDPRNPIKNERRKKIVQTIDIAPTILDFFGVNAPKNMLGKNIKEVYGKDKDIHDSILFGRHGEHINIFDGEYVYMCSPKKDIPIYEYTLMPCHMHQMFSCDELNDIKIQEPFDFTKGCQTMKIEGKRWLQSQNENYKMVDRLYNIKNDYKQMNNLASVEVARVEKMKKEIIKLLKVNDAPKEVYERYDLR